MEEYENLRKRYQKAVQYFEDENIPYDDKIVFLKDYLDLLDQIRVIYHRLKVVEGKQLLIYN